ncbi:MAG: TerB family tellurite resistance protein [Gammaproteobacteria bacterium]|nr:TerB family tellurite resistance protein [Gammaproteobacteria bacterium]MDP6651576.1 TerB family tellurite resistance protein [Gammaproteobacteria bacterium]
MTSAFVLVAAADGDLAMSEIERFITLIRDRESIFAALELDRMESLFRDIGSAILSDPIAGRRQALEFIAVVKADSAHCELVQSAAQIAILADNRKLASEQTVMEQICKALEIDVRSPD